MFCKCLYLFQVLSIARSCYAFLSMYFFNWNFNWSFNWNFNFSNWNFKKRHNRIHILISPPTFPPGKIRKAPPRSIHLPHPPRAGMEAQLHSWAGERPTRGISDRLQQHETLPCKSPSAFQGVGICSALTALTSNSHYRFGLGCSDFCLHAFWMPQSWARMMEIRGCSQLSQ